MAEFFVFFRETVVCDFKKAYFFLGKEVLVLNNGFNNYTACFEIRVPLSTAYM